MRHWHIPHWLSWYVRRRVVAQLRDTNFDRCGLLLWISHYYHAWWTWRFRVIWLGERIFVAVGQCNRRVVRLFLLNCSWFFLFLQRLILGRLLRHIEQAWPFLFQGDSSDLVYALSRLSSFYVVRATFFLVQVCSREVAGVVESYCTLVSCCGQFALVEIDSWVAATCRDARLRRRNVV